MVFKDGVAVGTVGGIRGAGSAVVAAQATTPYQPPNGSHEPTLALSLSIALDSTLGTNSDVQWQLSTDPAFGSTVWTLTSVNRVDGILNATTSALTNLTRYYWRTRAAETGTTAWGPWSPVWSVIPDTLTGRAYAYADLNVGLALTVDPDVTAVGYIDENVGVEITLVSDAVEYADENVGVEITLVSDAVEYAAEGDVNTATPTPHIWFLRPTSGREGDGVAVVGFGFGDLETTYTGVLERKQDPGEDVWEAVPITAWQTFPATADAYGPDRELDPDLGVIDMQHQVIEFTIPTGSEPPGFPLRVKTNGS